MFSNRMDKQSMTTSDNGISYSSENGQITDVHNNVGKSHKLNFEWYHPNTKRIHTVWFYYEIYKQATLTYKFIYIYNLFIYLYIWKKGQFFSGRDPKRASRVLLIFVFYVGIGFTLWKVICAFSCNLIY